MCLLNRFCFGHVLLEMSGCLSFLCFTAAMWFMSGVGASAQIPDQPLLPGLVTTATDGQRQAVFIMPRPHFTLSERQSLHPRLLPNFKAKWNGFIRIEQDGKYMITGDARVSVDGSEVKGQVHLSAGQHSVSIEYERKSGPARLQLLWQSDFFKLEPIPSGVFSQRAGPAQSATDAQIESGRFLWEELNCAACHQPGEEPARRTAPGGPRRRGPVLTSVGSRVTRAWLIKWLENPKLFQANATMPALPLGLQDRADVAGYLSGMTVPARAPGQSQSREPPGPPNPNLANAKAVEGGVNGPNWSGALLFNTIGCNACHTKDDWALTGLGSKYNVKALANYLHDPLMVHLSGRSPGMALTRGEASSLAEHLGQARNPEFEVAALPGDVVRGKTLVISSGCLNCHELDDGGWLETKLDAPDLKNSSRHQGCLAAQPASKAARYSLGPADRESLGPFLREQDISEAPLQAFSRSMIRFGCNTCHGLHGPAKATFERPPPPLTESGEKLRASWIEQVLINKKRIRPWLALRMPEFGEQNMRPLIPWFAAQAGAESGEGMILTRASPEQVQQGIKLIGRGEGGLSCINCHDFRGQRGPTETRGPDMVEMRDRLRADWVRGWLRDPQRHLPGTPMPNFFSEMPPAQAEQLIAQLLAALGEGPNMPNPVGLAGP
jgi:mono/diheme cytochrome c family protein